MFDYIFIILLYTFSILGIGSFFIKLELNNNKLNFKNNEYSIGETGIYGIVIITLIINFLNFFIPISGFINFIIILSGLCFFIIHFKNINHHNYYKEFLILIPLIIAMGLIGKTHDDFKLYHLPYTLIKNHSEIIYGVAKLEYRYAYNSSWLDFMSFFFIPPHNEKIYNISYIVLVIFFLEFLVSLFFYKKKIISLLVFFLFSYFLLKFYRISEYGTDLPVFIFSSIILIKLLKKKTLKENDLSFINILISFSFTLKIFFFLNFIVFIPLLLKNFFRLLKLKLIIFPIIFLSLFLFKNYKISGCYYYPIETTCVSSSSKWKIEQEVLHEDTISGMAWTKSWSTYSEKIYSRDQYIQNFNWIPNWYNDHYKNKIFNHHIILFIIFIFLFIDFNKKKIKKRKLVLKFYKKYLFLIIACLLSIIVWFINVPQFRNIIFVNFLLFFLICYPYLNLKISEKKLLIIFLIICTIPIMLNIKRIYSEYKSTDIIYSLKKNFPWPYLPLESKISSDKNLKINIPNKNLDACWNTEPLCNYFKKNINIKKFEGKKIILSD
jgi:hypothetical protein